ncbi:DUF1963 domain-containing protein [Muricauda oceani]|uniref:DUF1963 domain-containing protein n=1 Tax=Flagellimonas oceani TaxID=2698672 RepID=A0A6G7J2Z3_9FLAO|nr:DUF1963 domain-containing protein [Allomuricauda oceani]MBW8245279.1 DUF1963 domain-containing protein [Allomuricauda oceani]QII44832.1 DUF1963 domain-containing protein [Allomuricauda oceani]
MAGNFLNKYHHLIKKRTKLIAKDQEGWSKDILATRFGGQPAGKVGMEWPICKACEWPMTFIGQVHSSSYLHASPFHFFSFFYCHSCNTALSRTSVSFNDETETALGWKIFAYETLKTEDAFLIPLPDYGDPKELLIKEQQVESILEDSFPDFVGFELYIPVIWSDMNKLIDPETNRVTGEYWDKVDNIEKAAGTLVGFKQNPHLRNKGVMLGGYPYWCNGPDETPSCTICESPMELLLQISPTQIVKYNWGDCWTSYIFYCSKHKQQFALCFQGT